METTEPLATESFSYSWLTDKKPPIPEFPDENQHNFKFDVPVAISSQASLVHADEIFSFGHLMPTISRPLPFDSPASVPASPVSRTSLVDDKTNVTKWRKSLSKRIFEKCVKFARSTIGLSRKSNRVSDLERKVFEIRTWNDDNATSPRHSSALSAVAWGEAMKIGCSIDLCHGLKRGNTWRNSLHASPSRTPHRYSDACYDAENSIREAILYCKRTIEK